LKISTCSSNTSRLRGRRHCCCSHVTPGTFDSRSQFAARDLEEAPAGEHVGQGVVLGEVNGVPGGQHVDQRAEADAARVLGQHGIQENDVGDDLEPVVVEVVLGRPQGVVAEAVAGLGVGEEIGVGSAVVLLTVVPGVRGWPVDPGVGHVPSRRKRPKCIRPPKPARWPVSAGLPVASARRPRGAVPGDIPDAGSVTTAARTRERRPGHPALTAVLPGYSSGAASSATASFQMTSAR
jgi:hypothetical protein